jgi:hypothetical protein
MQPPRWPPSLAAILVVAALSLLSAGCGHSKPVASKAALAASSSQHGPQTPPPSSKRQSASRLARSRFIAAADALCLRLNAAIADPAGTVLNNSNLARLAPRHAVLEKKTVGELSSLSPPASMASDWPKLLAYRRTLARELAELGTAARTGDTAAIKRLAVSKGRVHQKLAKLAARVGFTSCGQAGGTPKVSFRPTKRPGAGHSS